MEKLPIEFQFTLIAIAVGSLDEPDIHSIRKLFSDDYIKFAYKVGWIITNKGNEYLEQLGIYRSDNSLVRKFKALI